MLYAEHVNTGTVRVMSSETGSERTQRTVAELLAQNGQQVATGGGRRRRRAEEDDAPEGTASGLNPQSIIDRVLSDSGRLMRVTEANPATSTNHHAAVRPQVPPPAPPVKRVDPNKDTEFVRPIMAPPPAPPISPTPPVPAAAPVEPMTTQIPAIKDEPPLAAILAPGPVDVEQTDFVPIIPAIPAEVGEGSFDGFVEEDYVDEDYADGDVAYDEDYVEDYVDGEYADDEYLDEQDLEPEAATPQSTPPISTTKEWLSLVGLIAGGVVGGAAVWLGFDYLWGTSSVGSLIAAVLVTAGLVFVVRKIRHASDPQTTILAAVVGAVVTFSPAILLWLR
jgi:hypothetical protein